MLSPGIFWVSCFQETAKNLRDSASTKATTARPGFGWVGENGQQPLQGSNHVNVSVKAAMAVRNLDHGTHEWMLTYTETTALGSSSGHGLQKKAQAKQVSQAHGRNIEGSENKHCQHQ